MKKYKIEITEILQKIVSVSAKNKQEAILKIKQEYDKGNIILDSQNYIDTEVSIIK